ncbi:MAG: amidinotransferase [Candidatus Nomurabacteria bacterium]|jgi:N-dimethylarginine dimethylaminohydrolase|nr:amidinotransferase [Candidatus Nomurabacteria bacterium]
MLNAKVLISGADFFALDQPINPYYDSKPVNVPEAKAEHRTILENFYKAEIEILQVTPPANSQDGVYTANWGLVRNGKVVLSRLPNARKNEEKYAEAVFRQLGLEVIHAPEDWRFSGQGDSLPCGNFLLSGSGYRSDPRAQKFAAEALGFELVQLHAVPKLDASGQPVINSASGWEDSLFYDIDLAISVLRDDLIAYCPEAFDEVSRVQIAALPLQKIEVDYDEAVKGLACNLVSTGETVIMSAHAPKFQAEIEKNGLKVLPISAPELARGGGYIRCVSLTIS